MARSNSNGNSAIAIRVGEDLKKDVRRRSPNPADRRFLGVDHDQVLIDSADRRNSNEAAEPRAPPKASKI
jgi:hypothetical protein